MKKNTSLLMHLLFGLIVLIELLGRLLDNIQMEYVVKPLIMIWIAVYFLLFARKSSFAIPVLLAFFFSWIGDNSLMLSGRSEYFFFAGVGSFFFAQLSYIYTFARYSERGGKGFVQKNFWVSFLFLGYLVGILAILFPGLDGVMKTVITIYALSLIGMSVLALNRSGRVSATSFRLVFIGSLLFLLSDSMIAVDKFRMEIPLAGFLIMSTYIAAQYLIMRGLILEE
jgi:uncharacterized membrane protein YhhN